MMFLNLTFDHQIVDGAPAAEFLQAVFQGIDTIRRAVLARKQMAQGAGGVIDAVQQGVQVTVIVIRPVRQTFTPQVEVSSVAFEATGDVFVQDDILLEAAYQTQVFVVLMADKRRLQYIQQRATGKVFFDSFHAPAG